ncbi:MAG: sodium:calcium antiporter [Planctomycetaceae bacterium]|nr:sodium:calcium antiporter [Planctomycetaceae bacterium]
MNMLYLLGVMVIAIAILGKSADWMVDKSVTLSLRTGMPKVIVGATIVSVGTTFPEAVVSVLAALNGNPDIALGNAVGSVICDAGLILGTACLISPLPLNKKVVNRQGWVQFGAGIMLVVFCLPFTDLGNVFQTEATLPQWAGFVLVCGLVVYMIWSVRLAKHAEADDTDAEPEDESPASMLVGCILVGCFFVVLSSIALIEATKILATEAGIPEAVIASTLVAFGTSLPELVTAVTAARKGQGELAVGNVIGADILNVLFVAGAAAAITPEGLVAESIFFRLQFPAMLIILLCFRVGILAAKDGKLTRPFGAFLVCVYIIYGILNALFGKSDENIIRGTDGDVTRVEVSSSISRTFEDIRPQRG